MNNGSNLKFAYRDQIVGLVTPLVASGQNAILQFRHRTLEVHGTQTDMTCR